jgi:CheY-like chemotaxis protein
VKADALAAAAGLAAGIGGALVLEGSPGGARFVLDLPLAGVLDASPVTATAEAPDGPPPVVLVCDDVPSIRTLLVRLLERSGFRVHEAATGRAALEILAAEPVDVVLTDQHMADLTGVELFDRVTVARPELRSRFVLMSGDPDDDALIAFTREHGIAILPKPFETQAIADLIRDVARR